MPSSSFPHDLTSLVNCGVKKYLEEDHRSYIRNLCSCVKKVWKKRLVRDSNPWPLRYRCSALPIELTRQLGAGRWIGYPLVLQLFQCLLKDEDGKGVHFYLSYFKTSRPDQPSTNWCSPAKKKRKGIPFLTFWFWHKAKTKRRMQSNLSNTDTEGTERSVRIREVSL